jgi:subfamily B ATP-binding cassette protein MsbA
MVYPRQCDLSGTVIALTPQPQRPTSQLMTASASTPDPTPLQVAARLFNTYLRPRWKLFSISIGCAILGAAMTGLLGSILNPVFNQGLGRRRFDLILGLCGLIVLFGLVRGAAQVAQSLITNRLGHRMVGDIQAQLFGTLVRADIARLRDNHSGAYLSSVLYDATLIREAATNGIVNYTQQALTVVFCVVGMAVQDPYLTVIVLVAAPVASLVMRRFSKRTRKAAQGAMSETSALSTAVMESLDGIKIVKIENREAFEEARVAAVIERRQKHIIKGANARAAAAPVTETLTILVTAAVILYAGWRAAQHGHAAGEFISFLALLGIASQSLRQVANLQTVFSEGLTAAGRLFAALDVKSEVGDAPDAKPMQVTEGTIRFDTVCFGYTAASPALIDVTLEVRRGETAALVGPSGGGKSTILNLIPRFYDVTSGAVTIDGQDVRGVTLASLRHQIALVTQEPFLFDDSIRANIAYARPDATLEEVEAAARAADAHEFILNLPHGYDTSAGEAGTRLSGGQRQRISIARAFLKNAPILLLDEATSALDTESEQKVQAALERLMAGRATLLIAHRLSTVRNADRIYVIEAGRVVEQGTHRSLTAKRGLYARLAHAQNLDVDLETPAAAANG